LESFRHAIIDKVGARFDQIALFGAILQRKMFPEQTGNLDRSTRYTCVPNLVLAELAQAHHTREIAQFLHDHDNGANGITIAELVEFVKRCKRVSLHLFTAMGATAACYSPQVKAGTTVHSIIGLISEDHMLRFVNESDRKSILKSGTVLPGMLGRQIWDVNYMGSVEVATTMAAKVVLIDVPHFNMCEFIYDTILAEGKYIEDLRFKKESGIQAFRSPSDAGQVYELSTEVQMRHDLYDRLAESTCDKLSFGHCSNDSWAVMAGNVYEVLYSHSFVALSRDMGLANWKLLFAAPVNALVGNICTMQCLISNREAEAVYAKEKMVPPVIVSIDIIRAHAAILGNREAADDWNLFSQFSFPRGSGQRSWSFSRSARVC
jgi:hypothetical protein